MPKIKTITITISPNILSPNEPKLLSNSHPGVNQSDCSWNVKCIDESSCELSGATENNK